MFAMIQENGYVGYILQPDPNDPRRVVKKFSLFEFTKVRNTTLWLVASPLNLAPTDAPLPKFKDYFPKFLANGIQTAEENLVAFSNAFHNIGENENDIYM